MWLILYYLYYGEVFYIPECLWTSIEAYIMLLIVVMTKTCCTFSPNVAYIWDSIIA